MINFDKVEQSVKTLKQQFAAGTIDKNTFEARLLELIDFAADGYYWMFGHETERWYQHDGQEWIQKDPGNLRLLAPREPENPHQATDEGAGGLQITTFSNTTLTATWRSVEWGWLIMSLALLILIGWIVYTSSLI